MPTNLLTAQLDRIESTLPTVPAKVFHLQRTITGATIGRSAAVAGLLAESTRDFLLSARTAGKTVTGQTRAAAEDVVTTARVGARTVAGQSSAQGRRVAATATDEATTLLDRAIDAVEEDVEDIDENTTDRPGSGKPYEQWTKAELLERARELDIEGRAGLSKPQLIKALRA